MILTLDDLRRMGYELDASGNAVRAKPPALPDALTDADDVTWQEKQRQCYRVFAKAGCEVWWLSQPGKVKQTPGLPDLLIFGPPGAPFHAYWETKAGRGRLSGAQRRFALHCQRTNVLFGSGGERAARAFLHARLLEAPLKREEDDG